MRPAATAPRRRLSGSGSVPAHLPPPPFAAAAGAPHQKAPLRAPPLGLLHGWVAQIGAAWLGLPASIARPPRPGLAQELGSV